MHLDGVIQACTPKIAHFNGGNLPYELQILSNSMNVLEKYKPTNVSNINPVQVPLNEVLNTFGCICKFLCIVISSL